jgi:hypothetical protein
MVRTSVGATPIDRRPLSEERNRKMRGDVTAKRLRRDPRIAQLVPVKRSSETEAVDWVVTLAPGYALRECKRWPDEWEWVTEFRRSGLGVVDGNMRLVMSIDQVA